MFYLQKNSTKLLCTLISFCRIQVRYLPRRIINKLIPKEDTICKEPLKINPFEKYAYLFKKNHDDEDSCYRLHYGTVRFDNDNIEFGTNSKNISKNIKGKSFSSDNDNQIVQKLHKKHEKNVKQKPSIWKIMPLCSDEEKSLKHKNANSVIIPEYHQKFNTDNVTECLTTVQADIQSTAEFKNDKGTDNYFDEQYFSSVNEDGLNIEAYGNHSECNLKFNAHNSIQNLAIVQTDVQSTAEFKNDKGIDNYFDEQYFSSVNEDGSNIEANGNHSECNLKFNAHNSIQNLAIVQTDVQSTAEFKNDKGIDNYFDEQYFSSVNEESSDIITTNANQILVATVGQEIMSDMRIAYSNDSKIKKIENDKLLSLSNNHLEVSAHSIAESTLKLKGVQEVKMGKAYAVNLERTANIHRKQDNKYFSESADLFTDEEKNVTTEVGKTTSDSSVVYSDANKIEKFENKLLNLNNNHLRYFTKINIISENEKKLEFKNLVEAKVEKACKGKLERKISNYLKHENKYGLESDDLVLNKKKNDFKLDISELISEKDEYKNSSSNSKGKIHLDSKFYTGEDIVKRLRSGNVKELTETFPEENFEALKGHSYYDTKGYRLYTFAVPQFHNYTKQEIFSLLKSNILYNKDGLLAINKPYGLVCQSGSCLEDDSKLNILNYLEMLAKHLKLDSIIPVHRLDRNTTGVFLFALDDIIAKKLKDLFASSQLIKIYWALCKGIPSLPEAKIEIPIMEGKIGNKYRMVLNPIDRPKDIPKDYTTVSKCFSAITEYKLLSHSDASCASLLEVLPLTGIKHQIRVHLGFGLKCPILGDHKYSHLKKLAPQTLNDNMLKMLKVRQQKVRTIPMHLHARQIVLPEFQEGKNVLITAPLPKFFKNTLRHLKLSKD